MIRALPILVALAVPAPASAQPAEDLRARQLFEQAGDLAGQERWGEALEYFRRARMLVERPSIVFNIGVCLFTLGRHVEAVAAFDRFLEIADRERDADQIERTAGMLRQSRAAVAMLEVRVSPPDAALSVDGRSLPGVGPRRALALDPGEHVLRFETPRHEARDLRLSLLPGQQLRRTVDLPLAAERGGGVLGKPVFWIVVAAGLAVAGGVVAGILLYDPGVEDPIPGNQGVQLTLTAE